MTDLYVVAIDPGHPSHTGDVGCAFDSFVEKDYTLIIAQRLRNRLLDRPENVGVLLTRWQDEVVDFESRVRVLDAAKPQFVLSLHVDSHSDNRVYGMQAFRLGGDYLAHAVGKMVLREYDRPGYYIDSNGQPRLRKYPVVIAHPTDSKGEHHWTRNAWHVLSRYKAYHPVLIEMGFASNEAERDWLTSPDGMLRVVKSLEAGIMYAYEEFGDG